MAEATARELPELSLDEALELTLLYARKGLREYPRVAARWLQCYLEEDPAVTIEEAGLAASSLIALTGVGYQEAVRSWRHDAASEARGLRGPLKERPEPPGTGRTPPTSSRVGSR